MDCYTCNTEPQQTGSQLYDGNTIFKGQPLSEFIIFQDPLRTLSGCDIDGAARQIHDEQGCN